MSFSLFKSDKIKVKYVEKLYPSGYRVINRSVKQDELDVLRNDPNISHLEING